MKTIYQLFLKVFFVICFERHFTTVWSIGLQSISNKQSAGLLFGQSDPICYTYTDLTLPQRRICQSDQKLMASVIDGVTLGKDECKKLFKNYRWNCADINQGATALGHMRKAATKEVAFHSAIIAAGIVHTVARNCMRGDLSSCKCSRASRPQSLLANYQWGGCGDNIQYGDKFTKNFFHDNRLLTINGSSESKLAAKLLMDDHNIEVGRLAVVNNKKIVCKCIGATFQCPVKTCWYQVQDFELTGRILKKKYLQAKKATLSRKNNGKKVTLRIKQNDLTSHKLDLVFTESSPSYCSSRININTVGTVGRTCDPNGNGPGSCNRLCCGRGHNTESRVIKKTCHCKFTFCCEVKCQVCKKRMRVTVCR